jgi:hypothetical protein
MSARDLGSTLNLGKIQRKHSSPASPARTANHCNWGSARL